MAINFDGWQSSNNLITVQNPCYIVNGFKMFLAKYNNVYKLFAPPAVGLPFYSDGITSENYSILLTVLKG